MIRKLTKNEKSCNPTCDYKIVIPNGESYLTQQQFNELAAEVKNLDLHNVTNCNFKTVIALYEDVNSILATSEQILPMHKGDKLTINDRYYMVDYVDYDFDKAIFEIVVTDDN